MFSRTADRRAACLVGYAVTRRSPEHWSRIASSGARSDLYSASVIVSFGELWREAFLPAVIAAS